MEPTGFSPTNVALLAAVVALLSIVVTVLVTKGNSDAKYVTKEQCATERQLQCAERAALRDQLDGLKRTMRVALNMNRALVTYADIPDEIKTAILNNDGGVQ
ncbi:MAG: hypothetical protein KKA55_01820 [Proteobacteria bacterium]|nr:hypothetical protein [Pseudomonadota bacterium]MBU1594256.1 hypothetical protein [Pseudomonadota bacterium]